MFVNGKDIGKNDVPMFFRESLILDFYRKEGLKKGNELVLSWVG